MIIYSKILTCIIILILLILASLFSFLETAAVAVSEHKLKALKSKKPWARYAYLLKKELERVLIFSLFGNSLFNAVFTTVTTVLVTNLLSNRFKVEVILPLTTLFIALFIIIFSEALPKVIAARNPLLTLKIIAIPLYYLFYISKPMIWLIDKIIYSITRLIKNSEGALSLEELKSIIADKRLPFKDKHRSILLNSMNLEVLTVKEVLIPLRMVEAINLNGNINAIRKQIFTSHHTRILVYLDKIDNIIGFIHVRDIIAIEEDHLTRGALEGVIRPIEYVNDYIPLIKQINHSSRKKIRIFIVINEYGDPLGIACLEDMLEMVFGDFTTDSPWQKELAVQTQVNEIIVDGTMLLRDLNDKYSLDINLFDETKTVNGLVLNILHEIPNIGVCFKLDNLVFEIISVGRYWVERVKITILNE